MLHFFKQNTQLKKLQKKRIQCLKNTLPDTLRLNLIPAVPAKKTNIQELSFLVVDFETTGFNTENDDILSIGWVEISGMQVDLSSQKHLYINNATHINEETAIINHIVPQMVSYGTNLSEAIDILLHHTINKILVVHGKVIEKKFLDHYIINHLGITELPFIWIDTLRIERWCSMEKGQNIGQDNRLSSARKRYNLPQYTAHNALIDSIATAELFLAQISHIYPARKATFGHLYKISQ